MDKNLFNKICPTMNLRYNFSKETESELLQFLRVAKQRKCSENCDLEEYKKWSKLLPPDPDLVTKYEEANELPFIDLCSDEETPQSKETEEVETNVETDISDAAFVIKENLQTQNDLSEGVKKHLCKRKEADLEVLFKTLQASLSNEEVYYFGTALMNNINSNLLAKVFCHHLLVPRLKKEYCEKVLKLLEHFSEKHTPVLLEHCSLVLQELSFEETPLMLQYLKRMSSQFQASLLRIFILAVSKLDDNYLTIVGSLLNTDVEYEALSKFIEMLSNVADDHNTDKNFGKLLMDLVEALGPNLIHVEQPLKHVIAGHNSVWKSKLEKKFTTSFEDSLFFSQSFRN